jgi:hypothetical protein
MELVSQPYSIIPVDQGQRGFSLFLVVDQGRGDQGKRIWKRLLAVDGRKAPPSWQLFLREK